MRCRNRLVGHRVRRGSSLICVPSPSLVVTGTMGRHVLLFVRALVAPRLVESKIQRASASTTRPWQRALQHGSTALLFWMRNCCHGSWAYQSAIWDAFLGFAGRATVPLFLLGFFGQNCSKC